MKTSRLLLAFLLLLTMLLPSPASIASIEVITPQSFMEHVLFLADPRMEGRKPGTPQCRRAARYIASKFKAAGLKPAGDDDTYFQNLTYKSNGEEIKTRNVLAILPGSDEKLKEEAVVIMAHYDHLGKVSGGFGRASGRSRRGGRDSNGGSDENEKTVYPGANDNASGTAGIIEIARAIKEKGITPRRTLLFIAATAEEAGLKGSGHYVDNPVIPLEKTMIVVTLDMIGNYYDSFIAMGVGMSPQIDEALDTAFENSTLTMKRSTTAGSSDNLAFNSRYIPSVFFFTGLDEIFHTPADKVENINSGDAALLLRGALKAVCFLADADKIESSMGQPRGYAKPYLGITTNGSRGGAVSVGNTYPESPAAKAGIKQGDVILSIGKKNITTRRDVNDALSNYKAGDEVEIRIRRGDKTFELQVKLGKQAPYSPQSMNRRAA